MTNHGAQNAGLRGNLLTLLSDLEWHEHMELRDCAGTRYSARLLELKRLGYQIESEPIEPKGKRYRMTTLKRGPRQDKQVKIFLDESDAEALLMADVTPHTIAEVRRALGSFRANRDKL